MREVPYLNTSVRLNKGLREKVEEEEKVSLLMILKRRVGESHHISIVKEPEKNPQVLKYPKVRELHSYQH